MGAHPRTQQNISTGVKHFAGLGPQSLFFFSAFFLFNIAASVSTPKCRTWIVGLSYPSEKPDRTPGSSAVSQTEKRTVTKPAFTWGRAQAKAESKAPGERRALSCCPLLRAPAWALLRHGTQPASGSVSCGTAPGAGLKFGPAEVKGPFSRWLPRGRLSSPGVYDLLHSRLPQWHLPGAKTKYSGSPKWHN